METKTKVILWTCGVLVVAACLFCFFKFGFVYSEGVNEGDINYFQKEGFIFKTYEGKMIQTGLKSKPADGGAIQSNEFKFSVADEKVAEELMTIPNAGVKLHWHRYLGTLPWRGNSPFVVDSVVSHK